MMDCWSMRRSRDTTHSNMPLMVAMAMGKGESNGDSNGDRNGNGNGNGHGHCHDLMDIDPANHTQPKPQTVKYLVAGCRNCEPLSTLPTR